MVKSLRILEAGHCFHPEKVVLASGSWRARKFPANTVLIEHSREGLILFDTGYSEHFARVTRKFPEKLYAIVTPVTISPETTVASRLRVLGVQPREIRHVILSHFHADHAGGLRDFSHARYHFHGPAFARYRGLPRFWQVKSAFLDAFFPEDFLIRGRAFTDADFRAGDFGLAGFPRAHDLFGDGSLLLLPLPGHAKGHVGLLVREAEGSSGAHFFVADAAWTEESVLTGQAPLRIASLVLDNWDEYLTTLRAIHRLAREAPGIHIVPCHSASRT